MYKLDRLHLGMAAALVACAVVTAYQMGRATAAGIPSTSTLFYNGSLLTFGAPDNGTHNMIISLYIQGSTSSPACTSNTLSVTVANGQFSLPLPAACVTIIHQNANVLAQVTVDGTALGMTPISAVPYAIEADTASNPAPGSALATLQTEVNNTAGLPLGTWNAVQSGALTVLGSANWTAIPGASVTFTIPVNGTLEMFADGSGTGAASPANHCGYRFVVDGTAQGDPTWGDRLIGCAPNGSGGGWWCNWSIQRTVSANAGAHTVSLQQTGWNNNVATGCTSDGGSYSIAKLHVTAHQ